MFQYLIYRSDRILNEQISTNNYKQSDLVEIKIPVKLSSLYDWTTYQNVYGQVQLSHNNYNYVKLKITHDTLYLMCLPNYEKTRLIDANIICAKQVSDSPLNKKSNSTLPRPPETNNKYNHETVNHSFRVPIITLKNIHIYILPFMDYPLIPINGQPPEAIS